jgi:hypothetical protein
MTKNHRSTHRATPILPESEPPFISLHTTVVLLAAFIIGLVIGGVTVLSGAPAATAVLAGLLGAGSSIPVLRVLIGPSR